MNATFLFETILYVSDPAPYFHVWNDISEQEVFVEFPELLFQDTPGEYFTSKFCFEEDRAYANYPKRLDFYLELGEALGFTDKPYEHVLGAYKIWQLEQELNLVKIGTDRI
jgi:hypothetical protein